MAGAHVQYENYVLSRGGTRIIRKILIANNGRAFPVTAFRPISRASSRTFSIDNQTDPNDTPRRDDLPTVRIYRAASDTLTDPTPNHAARTPPISRRGEGHPEFSFVGVRDLPLTGGAARGVHGDGG